MPTPPLTESLSLDVCGRALVLRPAQIEEILDLRRDILRPGLTLEQAIFEGDRTATTRHFGVFDGSRCVGCGTLMASQWEGQPAWQVRGMATTPEMRGCGLGSAILNFAVQQLTVAGRPPLFWCNARTSAVGFYEAEGWRVVSEIFDIPGVGPHRKMVKATDSRG